jgi:DNA repair exonuclease SbcCD ATPase subunit
MSNDYSRMIEYNKETDKFKEISTKLNKEFVILKDLKGKINGFKDYVYNDVIISNICKRMNKFISTYSCSKFNVNATIIDNGITWNVIKDINDEEYFVPYIKCSGFEKFILSLALRLTIANFHKNTFKCEQLFIDEGFVAFDSINLDKVPVMLNNLLGMYSSIIIVSHIDKLKDENYMNIDIKNVGGVSKIMF